LRFSEFGFGSDGLKRSERREEADEEKKKKVQTRQASKNQMVLLLLNVGEAVTGLGNPDFCFMGSGGR